MPTYDYVCENCGDRFEHFQKMSSEPLTTCSKCGGHLKRLIGSGMGIIFKGSGFYCTDYKASAGNSTPTPEKNSKATESKPAADVKASAEKAESKASVDSKSNAAN